MIMSEARSLLALVTVAVLSGAGPVAASPFFYQSTITGTLIHADGSSSSISATNSDTSAPAQYGATGTTYQVGASASAQDGGTVASNVDLAPQPQVSGVDYARNLQGQSTVLYRITISGPANSFLPVEVKANGSISWSQNGAADAYFKFSDYYSPSSATTLSKEINENDAGKNRQQDVETFSIDSVLLLNTADTYTIVESTYAIADVRQFATTIGYSNDNALVDPSFTILGPDAALYTVQGVPVSDTGTAPVPEPASWMMLLVGAAVAAAGLRRRPAATDRQAAA